jgi:hemin uptake protein HemP
MGMREEIIEYMSDDKRSSRGWFATWWFKFHIKGHADSKAIRRELDKMERDGIVRSDRRMSNNTLWQLVKNVEIIVSEGV